ncbi:MAG: hypothetical protein AMXMBFR53_01710 [Gemmatimonadota bacterium]
MRQVMERAAEAEAAQGPPPPGPPLLTRRPVVLGVALAFLGVVAWNVAHWRTAPDPLPPQQVEATLEVSVLAAAQAVEAYEAEHGMLPASLQELGFPEGMALEREGEGWAVVGEEGPFRARFDSREGTADFLRSMLEKGR